MTRRRKRGSRWEKIPPKRKKREPACKPGSVEGNHSSRTYVAARLKQPTRRRTRAAPCPLRGVPPYLVLLQVGFAVPLLLPAPRCALTAPFHPYHACLATAFGGLLSVALSVGLRPPGVTWHLALWSPDFPPRRRVSPLSQRLPGQLPQSVYRVSRHIAGVFRRRQRQGQRINRLATQPQPLRHHGRRA